LTPVAVEILTRSPYFKIHFSFGLPEKPFMLPPISESFFLRSAAVIAPRLLGHWLIRNTPDGPCGGPIVETEAYLADDPACHAYGGETSRNRTMWGAPGRAYVYLIYGCHHCVNAVCGPPGIAEAVLIRAIEPVAGKELMRKNRSVKSQRDLTSGPAKLCAALGIDRNWDGLNLCDAQSPLFIGLHPEHQKYRQRHGPTITAPRIGISKAAHLPLRFYLAHSPYVSRRPRKP
jgi:DNA-3-methyladenine glycosylase